MPDTLTQVLGCFHQYCLAVCTQGVLLGSLKKLITNF